MKRVNLKNYFYVPGDRITIKHRCVALVYGRNYIERLTNGNAQMF
ncbi:MAG TPA: hypothetical protein VHZ50_05965 [Puia sp.]|nr:hypothetical protein [Puia sp.]